MKTKLITLLILAVVMTANADEQSRDYARFEKWLKGVQQIAPRYGLKLHRGAKDEAEFFYLYCWQSDDHSMVHAIRYAKRVWKE